MFRSVFALIAVALLFPFAVSSYVSPGAPNGFVNDFGSMLSDTTETELEQELGAVEQSTSNEIAVVTVQTIGDETIESYAARLFEEWGIGKKTSDNGVLILAAKDEREIRIEVGYGLEGVITDALASSIIRNEITPRFQVGDYDGGIREAVSVIKRVVSGEEYVTKESGQTTLPNTEVVALLVAVAVTLFGGVIKKRRWWWLASLLGFGIGYFAFQSIGMAIFVALFSTVVGLSFAFGNGGTQGFMGRGGGFGSSGSFRGGGFGGGRSGGGGASGHW